MQHDLIYQMDLLLPIYLRQIHFRVQRENAKSETNDLNRASFPIIATSIATSFLRPQKITRRLMHPPTI